MFEKFQGVVSEVTEFRILKKKEKKTGLPFIPNICRIDKVISIFAYCMHIVTRIKNEPLQQIFILNDCDCMCVWRDDKNKIL